MKFLINTLGDNESSERTIEVDLDNFSPYYDDDILYIDGVPCQLSTARSIEQVGIREAASIFRDILKGEDMGRDIQIWMSLWEDV